MAILSNINGKFAVDSTGAVQFSGAAGTSGYILKSNGTGSAPTWVDPSTVIGGPYLPLSGGTLTGATATASGISFTVGGNLTGTTATFTGDVTMDTGSASSMLVFRNDVKTRKIQLWSTANNDYQFYGFGIEGSTLVYSLYDVGDDHVFFAGTSSTARRELARIKGTGGLKLTQYGSGSFTGTTAYTLAVDSSGNVIETTDGGGDISGSGVAGEVAYFTGTKTIANNAGMSFSNQQIQFDGIGGADGYILPYDQNPGYSNMAAGGFGLLFRESYDSYVTNNTYYYKTGGTSQWRAKYTTKGASVLSMLDGKFNFDTAPANTTSPYNLSLSTRMTILEGGNVGIGITGPTAPLQINNTASVKLTLSGGTTQNGIQFNGVSSDQFYLFSGNYAGYLGFGLWNATDSRMDMWVDGAGSIGIGTTSPESGAKLDVRAGSGGKIVLGSYDANYKVVVEGGDQLNFYNGASGTTAYMNYAGPGNILLSRNLFVEANSSGGTSGTVRIKSDGKVGIGITNPATKLDVYEGDIRRSGIVSGGYIELGSLPGYATNAYQSLTSGGSLHFANNGKYCAFLEGADTYFGVLNSLSQTKIFFATGSQNSYLAGSGNFGIGTTSPVAKLEAVYAGGYNAGIKVRSTSGYAVFTMEASSNSYPILEFKEAGTQKWQIFNEPGDDSLNLYAFGSGASTKMNIQQGGNVGIGIITPQTTLQVNGAASALNAHFGQGTNNSSGVFGGISLGYSEAGNAAYRKVGIVAQAKGDNAGRQDLHFLVDTVSDAGSAAIADSKMSIQYNTGDVIINNKLGIGTTSPSARLQVNYDGNNGGGDLTGYGILHQSSASGQATIGAHNTGDGYANLNLSSIVGGSQKLWHISKRPNSNGNRLEYFFFDSTFSSRFIFTYLGDFHADGDIIAYSTTASDKKLKDNIKPINNALGKIKKLNGVSFTWNCGSRKDEKDLGVIAQNVETVLPELVREKESPYHDDQTIKTVDYEKLTAVLIEAVKELEARVKELENK